MHACYRCGKEYQRTSEFFGIDSQRKDGLSRHCKPCLKEINRAAYEKKIGGPARNKQDWRETGLRDCAKCKTVKPATNDYFNNCRRYGLASWCKSCEAEKQKKYRKTREKFENSTHKQCVKCWEIFDRDTGFYRSSRLKDGLTVYCKSCQKDYLASSKEKHRSKWHSARAKVIESTPHLKMNYRILGLVRSAIKRNGMPERPPSVTSEFWKAIGYTRTDLAEHLERQFLKGMGWHNMREWHIDHIVPVSDFKFQSFYDSEFQSCWSLSNLRPLWAKDNLAKNDKREFLI